MSTIPPIRLNPVKPPLSTGCCLSPLLFLPYLTRHYHPLAVLLLLSLYACIAFPLLGSSLSAATVCSQTRRALLLHWTALVKVYDSAAVLVCGISKALALAHRLYWRLEGFRTTTNQVVFFMMAEKSLCPEQRFTCLYSLQFYTILAHLGRSLTEKSRSLRFHATGKNGKEVLLPCPPSPSP
ncbi:unnamed protein product, partial [Darwinula stevensoni]